MCFSTCTPVLRVRRTLSWFLFSLQGKRSVYGADGRIDECGWNDGILSYLSVTLALERSVRSFGKAENTVMVRTSQTERKESIVLNS